MSKRLFLQILILFVIVKGYGQQYTEKQIDSILSNIVKMGDSIPNKAIESSLKSYKYSEIIDYKKGMAISAMLAGKNLYDTNQYDKSLEQIKKSEQFASEIKDYELLAEAYRIKGISYIGLGLYGQGFIELKKGLKATSKIATIDATFRQKGLIYNDIAVGYDRSGEVLDSIKKYFILSYDQFNRIENQKVKNVNLSLASANVGACFLAQKQYNTARAYLIKAVKLAEKENYNSVKLYAYLDLGNLEFERKQFDKTISYYQKALYLAKKLKKREIQRDVYLNLSKAYDELGDKVKEETYSDKYFSLNDSLQKKQQKAVVKTVKKLIKEEYSTVEKIRNTGAVVIIVSALFTVTFLFFAIRLYKRKKKEKRKVAEKKQRLENKKEILEKVILLNGTSLDEVLKLAKDNDPMFLSKFEASHPDFYNKILQEVPSLSKTELIVCAFLKLGFPVKDIALYTNVTVRSVEARIYRIRKKANLEAKNDISIWIAGL
jgi:tetratricopeptide (TPR) repeat protein